MSSEPASPPSRLSYRDAGVDIDAGDALVDAIKPLAARTLREGVLAGIGGFGALFELPRRYREPVLVSGTDGVGTKLRLAFDWGRHDTVGIDLVAMSVNDVLVQGAEPLFFLDYFACGKLEVGVAARVVGGIAEGCSIAGCALIGGETAEMPGMYPDGEYDLAGFCVGAAEKSRLISGGRTRAGDVVLGLESSGVHSNVYSLVLWILDRAQQRLPQQLDGMAFRDALMMPTRIYCRPVLDLLRDTEVRAMAHITGGGLLENIPRVLPEGLQCVLEQGSWRRSEVFDWLQAEGNIDSHEMFRTFNCGIGYVLVLAAEHADAARGRLRQAGESCEIIGHIAARGAGEAAVVVR